MTYYLLAKNNILCINLVLKTELQLLLGRVWSRYSKKILSSELKFYMGHWWKWIIKVSKEINNSNLNYNVVDVLILIKQKTVNDIISKNKIDILINNAGITGPTMNFGIRYKVEFYNNINLRDFYCSKTIVLIWLKIIMDNCKYSFAGKDGMLMLVHIVQLKRVWVLPNH